MACGATLKRSLEFDPLHSPNQGKPIKRRRCIPTTLSPTTPPTRLHQTNPFADVVPKLSKERIAASISLEIKKMQRRRQLQYPSSSSPPPSMDVPSACNADSMAHCSAASFLNSLSPSKKDVPLFTFRQVNMICERLVKEREQEICGEYNTVLTNKIAEQYEAFLKFNHDQLHKRFGDAPMSYVS